MLGWEYPPHISGGLGTACEGLTRALAKRGIEIDFVVPHLYGKEDAEHMRIFGASDSRSPIEIATRAPASIRSTETGRVPTRASVPVDPGSTESSETFRMISVPAMLKPYLDRATYEMLVAEGVGALPTDVVETLPEAEAVLEAIQEDAGSEADSGSLDPSPTPEGSREAHYGSDLFAEVARYANAATRRVRGRRYDLVHAHDWMTFPAGAEIAARAGAPLVTHVHSLEYDRAAEGADRDIVAVEHQGLELATRVVAVSYYTRGLIHQVHGTNLEKISVVHNGVYARETVQAYTRERDSKGPVVLFLGRVTFQKGPEYFVEAAARVLQQVPDATFVMAGSGDMLPRMKAMVENLGIEESFRFPGFVRGAELERTFSTADVYVMPSVSEPFGIAPLEAMSYDRPVVVSKQSGVSEVLRNALKVDFWDVDRMASQIVGLLELPELRHVIVERAREEIRHIHWDAAAEKLIPIYQSLLPN
ncbi:MAG: glycosyltransferase family 4 protein [Myxococcota bacterium]